MDSMIVKIYTSTTFKRPNQKRGAYSYILECETKRGPATLTDIGIMEDVTMNQAEIGTLKKALDKMVMESDFEIYTDSAYLAAVLNEWLPKWKANGYRNSKGEKISEDIVKVARILDGHILAVHTKEDHEYRKIMDYNTHKEEERCLNSLVK